MGDLIGMVTNNKFMILKELFYVFTGALVVFCFLEIIITNLVLAYININLVLIIWFVNGILILTKKNYAQKNN